MHSPIPSGGPCSPEPEPTRASDFEISSPRPCALLVFLRRNKDSYVLLHRLGAVVDHLPAFFGVSAIVIVTPGPDTALTIRNTLFGGRRGGVFTSLGVSCGQATWAIATAAGAAALLQASRSVFMVVRIAGAAYLVFLGAQALVAAVKYERATVLAPVGGPASRLAPPVALRQGLTSNLTNPKMAVFFTSLLPQFAHRGDPTFVVLLALGIVFSLMTLLWLTIYAVLVAKAGDVLRRPAIRRTLEALTGSALVVLALRIAWEQA
jgi:threonine/homoserine/homoserine lactone efflux protein